MKVTVLHNQSLCDLAMMYTGNTENSVMIAIANNLPTDALIPAGSEIEIPDNLQVIKDNVKYFGIKQTLPATSVTTTDQALIRYNSGIDYWEIGDNFEVQ